VASPAVAKMTMTNLVVLVVAAAPKVGLKWLLGAILDLEVSEAVEVLEIETRHFSVVAAVS
jgi:hypothetical protein